MADQPNPGSTLPYLSRAPITEAVVEIRARAGASWEEKEVKSAFNALMANYPEVADRRTVKPKEFIFRGNQAQAQIEDLGWCGLEFQTTDKKQVARFERDSFTFARRKPYEGWNAFAREAFRLWEIYKSIAEPGEIQRLGLRYINNIQMPSGAFDITDYLRQSPKAIPHLNLTLVSFLHHDQMATGDGAFGMNVIRTIQPTPAEAGPMLILDIDVFSTKPFRAAEGALHNRLTAMRLLKNETFFASITEETIRNLQ